MISLSRLGMVLLGLWLIFTGLATFGITLPLQLMAVAAIIAGFCVVLSQFRITTA